MTSITTRSLRPTASKSLEVACRSSRADIEIVADESVANGQMTEAEVRAFVACLKHKIAGREDMSHDVSNTETSEQPWQPPGEVLWITG